MSKKRIDAFQEVRDAFEEARKELMESRRARMPKHPGTLAASLRKKLKITQGKAAELLNVSKNTWIRWEKGQCKPDELALELLPFFVEDYHPTPCSFTESDPFDTFMLAEHIPYCKRCRLAVKYIVVKGKL